MIRRRSLAVPAALLAAFALAPPAACAGDAGTIGDEDTLTGEAAPAERRRLADLGLRVRAELTGYSQRLLSGTGSGRPQQAGRFDALIDLDTGRAGDRKFKRPHPVPAQAAGRIQGG